MMILVDKLKEFIGKAKYLMGGVELTAVYKPELLDFINANQEEGIKGYCKDCYYNSDKKVCRLAEYCSYCSEFEPKELCTDDLNTSQVVDTNSANSVVEDIIKNSAKIKDDYIKAYMSEVFIKTGHININDFVLVEKRNSDEIVYYLRPKTKDDEPKVESNVSTQDLEIQARNCDNCGKRFDTRSWISSCSTCKDFNNYEPIDSKEVEK